MTNNSTIKNKSLSDKMSSAKKLGKGVINIAGALDGFKNSTNGFDRIMSAIGLIKGGNAIFDKKE